MTGEIIFWVLGRFFLIVIIYVGICLLISYAIHGKDFRIFMPDNEGFDI